MTSGLREEIERLQRVAVTFEADLAAAHDRALALDAQVRKLTADLYDRNKTPLWRRRSRRKARSASSNR